MKTIKCDLFVLVGYPHNGTCENTIEVSEDFETACKKGFWVTYDGKKVIESGDWAGELAHQWKVGLGE